MAVAGDDAFTVLVPSPLLVGAAWEVNDDDDDAAVYVEFPVSTAGLFACTVPAATELKLLAAGEGVVVPPLETLPEALVGAEAFAKDEVPVETVVEIMGLLVVVVVVVVVGVK